MAKVAINAQLVIPSDAGIHDLLYVPSGYRMVLKVNRTVITSGMETVKGIRIGEIEFSPWENDSSFIFTIEPEQSIVVETFADSQFRVLEIHGFLEADKYLCVTSDPEKLRPKKNEDVITIDPNLNDTTTHAVVFLDWDGLILHHQLVPDGGKADPPLTPSHAGKQFSRWDGRYNNVTKDEIVVAQFVEVNNVV